MTQEDMRIIKKSWLFRTMKDEEMRQAAEELCGHKKTFSRGQILIHEGDVQEFVGILLSGEVRISRITMDGTENLFQKLSSPYLLGADIVCTPSRVSPYTAYCSDEAQVWFFDYREIRTPGVVREEIRLSLQERFLQFIANENIRNFYKIDMLSSRNAREKILKYLRIQKRRQKDGVIEISYDREELASYLCMNRSVLSHTLSEMRREGILDFRKNRFILKE